METDNFMIFNDSNKKCWWNSMEMHSSVNLRNQCVIYTLLQKKVYTLFPSEYSKCSRSWTPSSQSEFPNNQATVCEEIPNGSKVLRENLLECCVRKFTKICFCHWLLCYWLIKCIPSNFDSELLNRLEFFHKLSFVWRGTSMSYPPYPLMGPTCCTFWVLTHRNSKCILSFGVECITLSFSRIIW